jgi:hypothetical protein
VPIIALGKGIGKGAHWSLLCRELVHQALDKGVAKRGPLEPSVLNSRVPDARQRIRHLAPWRWIFLPGVRQKVLDKEVVHGFEVEFLRSTMLTPWETQRTTLVERRALSDPSRSSTRARLRALYVRDCDLRVTTRKRVDINLGLALIRRKWLANYRNSREKSPC